LFVSTIAAQSEVPKPTWYRALLDSFREHLRVWMVAAIIGILTVFSGYITESLRSSLNRADLTATRYASFASDISGYVFVAENMAEFLEKGWTSKMTLTGLLTEYNNLTTTLRKNEYVYRAWLTRYWPEEETRDFAAFMAVVRDYDGRLHGLNDEFERVNIANDDTKPPLVKVDPRRAEPVAAELKRLTEDLKARANTLLVRVGQ
jgi:hypothetical protein